MGYFLKEPTSVDPHVLRWSLLEVNLSEFWQYNPRPNFTGVPMLFTNLNKRLDDEFLLIYTKLKHIENQLDLLIVKLNEEDNDEDLLSESEKSFLSDS